MLLLGLFCPPLQHAAGPAGMPVADLADMLIANSLSRPRGHDNLVVIVVIVMSIYRIQ